MRQKLLLALFGSLLVLLTATTLAQAQEGWSYTVQPRDTMAAVARRYNVPLPQLAAANGLRTNAWLHVGQRLVIPTTTVAPQQQYTNQPSTSTPIQPTSRTYTVKSGDTLAGISRTYGVSMAALQQVNQLGNTNFIYVGQQLTIPSGSTSTSLPSPMVQQTSPNYAPSVTHTPTTMAERWIYVDLSDQLLIAYQGLQPAFTTRISSGLPQYPTITGDFSIYVKYETTRMTGGYGYDFYDIPDVPYTMYYYGGYALHGAYWHNNFGTPQSHGCVNLSVSDALWLYNWASVGTRVVVRQ